MSKTKSYRMKRERILHHQRNSRHKRLAGLISMLLLVGAVGFAAGSTAFAAGTRTVTIGATLSPKDLTVAPGTTVTWQSVGGKHRVHSTAGPSKLDSGNDLGEGKAWSFTFTAPYSCTLHGGMNGTVIVPDAAGHSAAAPVPAAVPAAQGKPGKPGKPGKHTVLVSDTDFSPTNLNARAGDTVTWVNKGKVPHTATGGGFDLAIGTGGQHLHRAAEARDHQVRLHISPLHDGFDRGRRSAGRGSRGASRHQTTQATTTAGTGVNGGQKLKRCGLTKGW